MIVPRMKPEVDINVVDDHAAFTGGLHELEEYLKAVLGMPAGDGDDHGHGHGHDHGKPATKAIKLTKPREKAAYDGTKIKRMLDNMCEPFFDHVSPPQTFVLVSWTGKR